MWNLRSNEIMDLYKKCMELSDQSNEQSTNKTHTKLSTVSSNSSHITLPQTLYNLYPYKNLCKNFFYISDIHLVNHIMNKFKKPVPDSSIIEYVKKIARNIFSKELYDCFRGYESPLILFGGDTSTSFEVAKIFYTEFVKKYDELESHSEYHHKRRIVAVLGNHEFWEFPNINECYKAYDDFFKSIGILFLNNSYVLFSYEPIVLMGGTGFAGKETIFNADVGIYRNALSREEEIKECIKFDKFYDKISEKAKNKNYMLIVLTHNPISDWKKNKQPDPNCIYINGHTHMNFLDHNEEKNSFTYADNQIGYEGKVIKFKEAYIYGRSNPFAGYSDGYYEIKSSDYINFYHYMCEYMKGNGIAERMISRDGAKFFMIKQKGFYGFFLITSRASYICAGGRVKKICDGNNIEKFNNDFLVMVRKYLELLSPYRNAQERISHTVKSFGGSGDIHGCIVDIDFYNHIMLNPEDGTVTYYFSPYFGVMKTYSNMTALLESHNKELAKEYKKQLKTDNLIVNETKAISPEFIKVDIKNSLYSTSNRINQLQRLFSKGILRDWNDNLLIKEDSVKMISE